MKGILRAIQNKRSLLLLLMFAIVAVVFANTQVAKSDNCPGTAQTRPVFDWWPITYNPNDFCHDFALIDARNLSSSDSRDSRYANSQAEHDSGIHANIGDTVRVSIYFHNGASDQIDRNQTTAKNVSISSNFSTDPSADHSISGGIFASNAQGASSANHGGDIMVHTSVPTVLQYVPGTTALCVQFNAAKERGADLTKTCGSSADGTPKILIPLGDGVANGSIGIGDLKACFPYSGTLIFSLAVLAPTPSVGSQAILAVSKTVRDIANNETDFAPSINAHVGDQADFQITVSNTSTTASAQNVTLTEVLPSSLQFSSGDNSVFASGGENVGNLAPGQSKTIRYSTIVQQSSTGVTTNTVNASATNAQMVSASATVNVIGIVPPTVSSVIISTTNQVRDIANNEPNFSPSVNAHAGDQVDFQLTVTNNDPTHTANNVILKDVLPSGLNVISGSVDPSLFSSGLSLGNIAPGQTNTVNFSALVTNIPQTSSISLINNSTAFGSNTNTATASSNVNVTAIITTQSTSLSLTKLVRDIANNEPNFSPSVNANPGDQVDFQITITNNGQGAAQNVVLNDTLPFGLTFTQSNSSTATTTIASLASGQSQTWNLSATVNSNTGSFGSAILTNNVFASSSNAPSVSASATVNVSQQNRNITITKGVRDLSQGQTAYVTNTNVFNGDNLQYQIIVTNSGSTAINNINITDNMPGGLNFVPNSFGVSSGNFGTNFNSNLSLPTLAAGQSVNITFSAQVNQISGSIINTATVTADTNLNATAQATVNIIGQPSGAILTVTKMVKNLTRGNSFFAKQVSANPGDRIAYQIQIFAPSTVTNVTVFDSLPQFINFASGTAQLNSGFMSDGFASGNMNIGTITQGQTDTITFEATVSSNIPSGQNALTNTVNVSADHLGVFTDSATVFVNVSNVGLAQLSINKVVRDVTTNTPFQKSVNASPNDQVSYQITVTNTGGQTANNVVITDPVASGLNFVPGSTILDGSTTSDSLMSNGLSLGNMAPGQQHVITITANVTASSGTTIQNTAEAQANNTPEVQDTATIFVSGVQGANVNLSLSKTAFNETKNIDATAVNADKEDFITFTLTALNTGNAPATNFVISDDLSSVLPFASMVDMGGGTMNGNLISWPAQTIQPGSSVQKKFKVRINFFLPKNIQVSLVNTFGNTVTIRVNNPQVLGATITAPKTGASADVGFALAGLATAAFAVIRKKKLVKVFARYIPKIKIQ